MSSPTASVRSGKTFDLVIAGAGIVGTAIAAEATGAGLSVAIVEPDQVGGGATAAGMGHLVVMDDSEAQFQLTNYSRSLWARLSDELPRQVEYERSGTIWIALDDEEMAEVRRKHDYYRSRGVASEILDSRSLREAEPNLRSDVIGGLRIPADAVIYPPCAARFLLEKARVQKCEVFEGRSVAELTPDGARLNDGTFLSAGATVNATGHWAPELSRGIDVQKRKGHLVITERYPGFVRHQLVELGYLKSAHSVTADSVAFNVQPRHTGQILIGSSRQYGVQEKTVDQHILKKMIDRAESFMPSLANLQAIRVWTGFRAATPDKLPLIGRSNDLENVYLATGHEGLGITTSLATARLLVDELLDRHSEISRQPYSPSRVTREVTVA